MNSTDSNDLISLRRAADRLDISIRGLYRLIARKDLPRPIKIGGASKLFSSDLDAFLNRLKEGRKSQSR